METCFKKCTEPRNYCGNGMVCANCLPARFFVEYIFGWKGIGKVTVDALENLDFPVVMGSVLISSFFFIVVNICADIIYGIVDPEDKGSLIN